MSEKEVKLIVPSLLDQDEHTQVVSARKTPDPGEGRTRKFRAREEELAGYIVHKGLGAEAWT
jgi:hypothetical protein